MLDKKPNKKLEESLQIAVCRYLDFKYPDVIYTSDLSGIKLSIGSAKKAKSMRCKRYKIPDLLILHPTRSYSGLILELKKDRDELFDKNGRMRQSEHIIEQMKTLLRLTQLGYCAKFACGIDDAIEKIDRYLK